MYRAVGLLSYSLNNYSKKQQRWDFGLCRADSTAVTVGLVEKNLGDSRTVGLPTHFMCVPIRNIIIINKKVFFISCRSFSLHDHDCTVDTQDTYCICIVGINHLLKLQVLLD